MVVSESNHKRLQVVSRDEQLCRKSSAYVHVNSNVQVLNKVSYQNKKKCISDSSANLAM